MLKREPASVSRLTRLHVALLVATDRTHAIARARTAAAPPASEPEPEQSTYRLRSTSANRADAAEAPRYVP